MSDWPKVRDLFEARGFPFKVVPEDAIGPCWNGAYCQVRAPEKSFRHLSKAIHEFAHWLICPEERLGEIDFGLGDCSDSIGSHAEVIAIDPDREEALASWLGIEIEEKLHLPWGVTFRDHGWNQKPVRMTISQAIAELEKMGLMKNGRTTICD